jgi:hypothetical protein
MGAAGKRSPAARIGADGRRPEMNAPVDLEDDGDTVSIGRRYRSTLDRLRSLDDKWAGMADDARCWLGGVEASKFDVVAAAHDALIESEHLFLAVFRRRTETVTDIAVLATHAFTLLDRGEDDGALSLVRRALADIASTGAKMAGLDFSMLGPPGIHTRVRECLARRG